MRGRHGSPIALTLASWLVLFAVTVGALFLGRALLIGSENARVGQRSQLLARLSTFLDEAFDPAATAEQAAGTRFGRDAAQNGRLLDTFLVTPGGDTAVAVILFTRDGELIHAEPALARTPRVGLLPLALGATWTDAVAGRPGRSGVIADIGGVPGFATVVPAPTVDGVLVVLQQSAQLTAQEFVAQLGPLTDTAHGRGGLQWIDRNGLALMSYDPRLIGTRVLAEGAQPYPVGRYEVRTSRAGGDEVTTIGTRSAAGETTVFTQPNHQLFGDLRAQQENRGKVLLAVVILAVLAIATSYLWRIRRVRRSGRRVQALLSNSMDLVVVTSADGVVRFASPAIRSVLGVDPSTWEGLAMADVVHADDRHRVGDLIRDPAAGAELDVRLMAGEDRWFDVEASVLPEHVEGGGVLLTWHASGERKALRDELAHQARHDGLTGLAQRAVLTRRLEAIATRPEGTRPSGAVLFLDLDGFKAVNDTVGHDVGDTVLRTVAERLRASVRDTDLVARFGGDEFGVVLHPADETRAREVAARLVAVVSEPVGMGTGAAGEAVAVGVSVGLAWIGPGSDPAAVLAAADLAMYRSKAAGGGHTVVAPIEAPALSSTLVEGDARDDIPADGPECGGHGDGCGYTPRAMPRFAPSPPAPAVRGRRRPAIRMSAFVTVLAVLAISGVVVLQAVQARDQAQARRLAERLSLTARVADYASRISDRGALQRNMNHLPWTLDGSTGDDLVLGVVSRSLLGGPHTLLTLVRPDGRIIASRDPAPVDRTSAAWRVALKGGVALVPLTLTGARPRAVYYIPVNAKGRSAVLVVSQSLRDSGFQRLLEALGSLGLGVGGVSSVEAAGYITYSWNPDLIGSRQFAPGSLTGLRAGTAELVAGRDHWVSLAAVMPLTIGSERRYTVFQQPTSSFYEDVDSLQLGRLSILVLLVTLSILLIARSNARREQVLRDDARRLDALLQHAHDIVAVVDDGRATFVSSAVTGLLGFSQTDQVDRTAIELVHPEDVERLRAATDDPAETTLTDVRLEAADGGYRWFDIRVAATDRHPGLRGRVLTCHEVGVRRALQEELAYRARHDTLTGLANRAAFDQDAGRPFAPAGESTAFSILFVDLDRFKPVNDRYGHDTGDVVLSVLADRLRRVIRAEDLIYRIGGDEFVLVLRGTTDPVPVANTLLGRLREPIPIPRRPGTTLRMDATIGIFSSAGHDDLHTAVRLADAALYRAKASGRGRFEVSTSPRS